MSLEVISIGSDNLVRLDQLTDASTGFYINSATVTFTLTDASGNVVGGLSNVSMANIAGQNGRYEGNIPNAVSATMALNNTYTVAITAVNGASKLYRRLSCIAKYRSEW